MKKRLEKIYPGIANRVVCEGCSRENELVVTKDARQHFSHTCVCGKTTKYFVVNRREHERRAVDAYGTCWLDRNEKGITIKLIDLSKKGLRAEFIGRRAEIAPRIKVSERGRVIYNDGNGRIVGDPREVLFKNVDGLYVGAEFVTEEEKKEPPRPSPSRKSGPRVKRATSPGLITGRMNCPKCGHEIIERMERYTSARIGCPECGAVYLINLDRRKYERMSVSFPGIISDLEGARYEIMVRNISENGICFTLTNDGLKNFKNEEQLILSFNKSNEIVSGKATIASLSGDRSVHARFKSYKKVHPAK